jgi:chemotaxis protein CheX
MATEPIARPAFPFVLADGLSRAVPASFGFLRGLYRQPGAPSCSARPCDGLFAIMDFLGDFNWAYTLILPRTTAPAMVEAFAGFSIPYPHPDMGDVVGELANVLAGEVISTLHARKIKTRMGLPTVARGTDVEFLVAEDTPRRDIGFGSAAGPFSFRLMLARPTRSWDRHVGIPFGS